MMKYVMLLIVAILTAAIFALADVVGVDNTAHAQAGVPSNVSATNGANPGEVVVSWDPVAGASEYRVGWLALPDYQANIDNDRWRERFAYSDVNASSSYTVTRLTPGVAYYFITGRKQDGDIAWSQWATLTLNADMGACPVSAVGVDYDDDDDGLVEVRTLAQLDAIRLDLDGDSLVDTEVLTEYLAAFPGALDDTGCPADGCNGYELGANLDFDTNGNGEADAGDVYWNDGAGWEPIGGRLPWSATFDGNGYTIANLYIGARVGDGGLVFGPFGPFGTSSGYNDAGLFGNSNGPIRNVVLDGVDVTGANDVGSLVGRNERKGDITNSATTGSVTGKRYVGGLVGYNNGHISDSETSATVSGDDYGGGLVGANSGSISGSRASGDVSSAGGPVGGLVGGNTKLTHTTTITGAGSESRSTTVSNGGIGDSTAEGNVTGRVYVGGLVGLNEAYIRDSTASGDVAGIMYLGALVGADDGGTITNSTGTGTVSARE